MKSGIVVLCIIICINANAAYTDTCLVVNGTKVALKFPKHAVKACILVLPGWNFSEEDICEKSNFCDLADSMDYALVLPNMQKSIYQSTIFAETRTDWKQYHTYKWLTDTVFKILQNEFGLLQPHGNNFVFGISTGGRGVAILSYNTEDIFKAGAALSGDYDPTALPKDNLLTGYFGTYEKYPERWSGSENPAANARLVRFPLYLAHGDNDKVVPVAQTLNFYNHLLTESNMLHTLYIAVGEGHTYIFWQSQYTQVFKYFEMFLSNKR